MRALVVCLAAGAGCWSEQQVDGLFSEAEWDYLQTFHIDRLTPIECTHGDRCEPIARFGQQLFFDPGYSGARDPAAPQGKVACDGCHKPERFFADDRALSVGYGTTRRNVPGLVDLAFRETYIWNGKYQTIEDVLELALTSPAALSSTPARLVEHVTTSYADTYDALFPDARDRVYANAALAIGLYETQLVSGPSPFDRYLAGDAFAIDDAAKRGAKLFIGKALCSECHSGPLFADDKFHVTGVDQRTGNVDRGRFDVTQNVFDDGRFRTPTLRHVARTAPYMHAGQIATLVGVIEFYRWGGDAGGFAGMKDPRMVPLELTDADVGDLEAFLLALTGAPVDPTWTVKP